jgi:hypothetical protein
MVSKPSRAAYPAKVAVFECFWRFFAPAQKRLTAISNLS